MPTATTLESRWQALSAEQDALYANDGTYPTHRECQIIELRNAVLVWQMVQIEVEMGMQEIDDDYRNWKRAGERAARYLNQGA